MDEILDLLKQALGVMREKTQEAKAIVADAQSLKAKCEAELVEVRAKFQEIDAKVAELRQREAVIGSAEEVLRREAKLSSDVDAFRNTKASEENRLAVLSKDLLELQGQLTLRKDKLTEQANALEKEKAEYKAKVREEILNQLNG